MSDELHALVNGLRLRCSKLQRQLEERDELVAELRGQVLRVVEAQADAEAHCGALKRVRVVVWAACRCFPLTSLALQVQKELLSRAQQASAVSDKLRQENQQLRNRLETMDTDEVRSHGAPAEQNASMSSAASAASASGSGATSTGGDQVRLVVGCCVAVSYPLIPVGVMDSRPARLLMTLHQPL